MEDDADPLPPDDTTEGDTDAAEHREDEIADYLREHREV